MKMVDDMQIGCRAAKNKATNPTPSHPLLAGTSGAIILWGLAGPT